MSDFLLELSQNKTAKRLIQSAGLPIPMPVVLERVAGATPTQPLKERAIVVGGDGELSTVLAVTLVTSGAWPLVVGERLTAAFAGPGEAYGRRPETLQPDEAASKGRLVQGAVFDATGLNTTADLKQLRDFFQPRMRQIAASGHVLVLGRPPEDAKGPVQAATSAALEGFVRSLAKELGRDGVTANLIYVASGAEQRLPAVLRFFLSPASAFVSGQPLRVTGQVRADNQEPQLHQPLEGKVVLVTGAARGIGAATAEVLAAEGAHVVVLDRPADDTPASEIARKVRGTVLLADVAEPGAPQQIASFLKERFGGVDVVIHNAGVTRDKLLANMKPDIWDSCVDINLGAVTRITEALLTGVLRDGGRIVCLSSIAGMAGNNGQTNYAASKSGLIGFVKHLAPKLAGRGITVNAIAPGFIETRLTAAIPVAIREVGRRLSALGQGGQPGDVARAITFLATPGAQGVTGQVLRVCGGAFIGA